MSSLQQPQIRISADLPNAPISLSEQSFIEPKIAIRNDSTQSIVLHFSSGKTFDIEIYHQSDDLVALWSSDRMFSQAQQSLALKPGETKTFGDKLALEDLDGMPLPAGCYTLKVEIKAYFEPKSSEYNQLALSAESELYLV